ncbi:MAG: tRNA pseudouridine(38-40) synthase TruA, partial [Moheibacter sp.]
TADRFLRNMVRSIVGTLVDAGREKISLAEFKTIIEKRDRKFASGSAPAQGLYLVGVEYPKSIYTNE